MAKVVNMPKMGEAMEEGQIVSWMYEEGDKVEKGEPLFELMTDKSTMEFPCPQSGTLLKILVECEEDYDCRNTYLYHRRRGRGYLGTSLRETGGTEQA